MNQKLHDHIVKLSILSSEILECVQWEQSEDLVLIHQLALRLQDEISEVIQLSE
mgnify:CR=1 FL=1